MRDARSEQVWRGRIHLGDEPGGYGDAAYAGLAVELPLTLETVPGTGGVGTALVLSARDVVTYDGYPGHSVEIVRYAPGEDPSKWVAAVLATARLTGAEDGRVHVPFPLPPAAVHHLGVRVRVDTAVPAGLYDDFVITGLAHAAPDADFVASFGFRSPPP